MQQEPGELRETRRPELRELGRRDDGAADRRDDGSHRPAELRELGASSAPSRRPAWQDVVLSALSSARGEYVPAAELGQELLKRGASRPAGSLSAALRDMHELIEHPRPRNRQFSFALRRGYDRGAAPRGPSSAARHAAPSRSKSWQDVIYEALSAAGGAYMPLAALGIVLRESGAEPPDDKLADAVRRLPGLVERPDPHGHGQHCFALRRDSISSRSRASDPLQRASPTHRTSASSAHDEHHSSRERVVVMMTDALREDDGGGARGAESPAASGSKRAAAAAGLAPADALHTDTAGGDPRRRVHLAAPPPLPPPAAREPPAAALEPIRVLQPPAPRAPDGERAGEVRIDALYASPYASPPPLPPDVLQCQAPPGDDVFAALAAWPSKTRYAWEAAVVSVLQSARDRGSRLVPAAAIASALAAAGTGVTHSFDLSLTQCLRALPWVLEGVVGAGERAYGLA